MENVSCMALDVADIFFFFPPCLQSPSCTFYISLHLWQQRGITTELVADCLKFLPWTSPLTNWLPSIISLINKLLWKSDLTWVSDLGLKISEVEEIQNLSHGSKANIEINHLSNANNTELVYVKPPDCLPKNVTEISSIFLWHLKKKKTSTGATGHCILLVGFLLPNFCKLIIKHTPFWTQPWDRSIYTCAALINRAPHSHRSILSRRTPTLLVSINVSWVISLFLKFSGHILTPKTYRDTFFSVTLHMYFLLLYVQQTNNMH